MVPNPTLGLCLHRPSYQRQNAIHIRHHLLVRYPHGPKPEFAFHRSIAPRVPLRVVRIAIDFDDKPFRGTEEIHDTIANHVLTAKLLAFQSRSTQFPPQAPFRLGHVATHFPRPRVQQCASRTTTPNPLL